MILCSDGVPPVVAVGPYPTEEEAKDALVEFDKLFPHCGLHTVASRIVPEEGVEMTPSEREMAALEDVMDPIRNALDHIETWGTAALEGAITRHLVKYRAAIAETVRAEDAELCIGAVGHGVPIADIGVGDERRQGVTYTAQCVRDLLDRQAREITPLGLMPFFKPVPVYLKLNVDGSRTAVPVESATMSAQLPPPPRAPEVTVDDIEMLRHAADLLVGKGVLGVKNLRDLIERLAVGQACPARLGEGMRLQIRDKVYDALMARVERVFQGENADDVLCNAAGDAYRARYANSRVSTFVNVADLRALLSALREARAMYCDLLYQVGKVTLGETRHESARRIIRQHEDFCNQGGPSAINAARAAGGET